MGKKIYCQSKNVIVSHHLNIYFGKKNYTMIVKSIKNPTKIQ